MIKKISRFLCIALLIAVSANAGQRSYSGQGTWDLAATDSTVFDTVGFRTPGYYNRIHARIIVENFVDTTGTGTDFGDEDSLFVRCWAVFGGIARLVAGDSLVYVAADIPTAGTLSVFSDFNGDTLFLERIVIEFKWADTSSAQTGALEIPYQYHILHTWGEARR